MCIYSFQATDEIQRLRRQVSQARSPSPSRAASAVLLRVESERDAALADLRRTNTQLDNLEDKLKVCSYVENEESLKFISAGIKMQQVSYRFFRPLRKAVYKKDDDMKIK